MDDQNRGCSTWQMFLTSTFLKHFSRSPSLARRNFYRYIAVNSAPSRPSGPIYEWQERVENLEEYRAGGYHPIQLGDEFSRGRYRIIGKLGYGGYSTVWLARDSIKDRYVSLKVITAAASESNSEAKISQHLRKGNLDHPGRNIVSFLMDNFWIEGPNGRHQCLVSEVLGASIAEAKEESKHMLFPLKTARDITAHLASGLSYIHSHGIIHGGWCSPSRRVFKASPIPGLVSLQSARSSREKHVVYAPQSRFLDYRANL